ncbi:MAG: beta-ketoacyl-[acyl-carrier-protein] synthase family protein [Pseudomonadota bacterium]
MNPVYLNELGIINALGNSKDTVYHNMLAGNAPGMGLMTTAVTQKTFYAGQVVDELPSIPAELSNFGSRNNQLILAALSQIEAPIRTALEKYSPARIGVVMGSSTGGVAEAEVAFAELHNKGSFPDDFSYRQQEIGVSAEFIADYFQTRGPVFSISTACSSSGKVFASARGLIEQGLCDAVIVGGADSLCELTLNGFKSLEALSDERCNPLSSNRKGINIGEGAAIFLMSHEPYGVLMAGVGESSDAFHMTAPEPKGEGALQAMQTALTDAKLDASAIDYINLHGTGTRLNDGMECNAVYSLFGDHVLASSSKPLTGHTLGAAGATEAGLCWLLLNNANVYEVAPHIYDGQFDPEFSKLSLCESSVTKTPVKFAMSNSFAFGGSNVSVILGRLLDDA